MFKRTFLAVVALAAAGTVGAQDVQTAQTTQGSDFTETRLPRPLKAVISLKRWSIAMTSIKWRPTASGATGSFR